jgi:hypothetical protein
MDTIWRRSTLLAAITRTSTFFTPARSQGLDLLLLEHPQQLRLRGHGHVAHLVEEERAAMGEHELAVGAAALAEELALELVLGDGGHVHADEGAVGARARRVHRLGEHFLAGAGLAQQQHGGVELRGAPRLALHLHRRGAAADEVRERVAHAPLLGERLLDVGELRLELLELRDQRLQVLQAVEEHEARAADHAPAVVLDGHAHHHEGIVVELHDVEHDRLAGAHHLAHEAVGDHASTSRPSASRARRASGAPRTCR